MAYTLKTLLSNPGNYGGSRTASQIKYVVIHYTANDGDSDEGNANYFHTHVVKASAHYFVDNDSVTQSVPDLRVAWSVGDKKYSDCASTGGGTMYGKITNTNSLSIEMCDTKKDGTIQATEETMTNAAALCRSLMGKYHIPASNVYRHFDVSGKHCPAYLMDHVKWSDFKRRLTSMTIEEAKEILRTKADVSDATITFLSMYKYGDELMMKLAKAMI